MKTPEGEAPAKSGGSSKGFGPIALVAPRRTSGPGRRNRLGAETGPAGAAPSSSSRVPADFSAKVESATPNEFSRVMRSNVLPLNCNQSGVLPMTRQANRLHLDPDGVKSGLGRLVLSLVKLLHELLERQALRQVDAGLLREEEIDRLGVTLQAQAQEIERLRRQFGLTEDELNLDLGPLGRLF